MPRQRSENRDRALALYLEHDGKIANREIAHQLGVPEKSISGWKVKDEWRIRLNGVLQTVQRSTPKRRGAPKGSQNAKGNIGGHGGPIGNKKAVVTGEHETIAWDTLADDEKALYPAVTTDEIIAVDRTIRMYEIRERRMMRRIKQLQEGPDMVLSISVTSEMGGGQYGDADSKSDTREAAVERIQRIEDALTRVQKEKAKCIELRSKLVPPELREELERLRVEKLRAEVAKLTGTSDAPENDDGFLDALSSDASGIWEDADEE